MTMDGEKTCEELKRERSLASEEPLPEEMMSTMDPDCAFLNDASKRPDILYGVCNTDREIPDGVYVDMSGRCPAYNQPRQILQRVEEIKTLARIYSVGELVMHTVFLGASQEDIDAICGTAALSFGYESCAAKDLLTEMAKTGGGTFRDVNIGRDDASFLDYDYNSLKTPYHATAFVAYNENAQHSSAGLRSDSDGDGLADDDERLNGTNPYNTDSDDNDGYGDLFEQRYRRNGFNPTDDTVPALTCDDPVDTDGDGINDCEEAFIDTDPRNPDSDGDRILDGIELRVGTDPAEADADRDPDFDGVINRSEVQGNTDPNSIDGDRFLKERVRYTVNDVGERDILNPESEALERRRCYEFEIARMELAVTTQPQDPGRNRILLHTLGQPLGLSGSEGVVRQACVEVQYGGPTSKIRLRRRRDEQ